MQRGKCNRGKCNCAVVDTRRSSRTGRGGTLVAMTAREATRTVYAAWCVGTDARTARGTEEAVRTRHDNVAKAQLRELGSPWPWESSKISLRTLL